MIMSKIVMTGGGTAGHVMPNVALKPYLDSTFDKFYYIGSKTGMEKAISKNAGFIYKEVETAKLSRFITAKNLLILPKLLKGYKDAKKILKEISPDVIFSKGGFVSVPVVLAGKRLNIPIVMHESDLSIGLANKITAKFSDKVFTAFKETAQKYANGEYAGLPIKSEILNCKEEKTRELALKRYKLSGKKPVLLILGGSSGSKTLNDVTESAIDKLTEVFDVLHIYGKKNLPPEKKAGRVLIPFENEISYAYSVCDMALSRGGATALFELISLKIPSVIIPLSKKASRGDQIENAEYFYKKGLIDMIYEENLTENSLLGGVYSVYKNKEQYIKKMKENAFPNANKIISDYLKTYAKK